MKTIKEAILSFLNIFFVMEEAEMKNNDMRHDKKDNDREQFGMVTISVSDEVAKALLDMSVSLQKTMTDGVYIVDPDSIPEARNRMLLSRFFERTGVRHYTILSPVSIQPNMILGDPLLTAEQRKQFNKELSFNKS